MCVFTKTAKFLNLAFSKIDLGILNLSLWIKLGRKNALEVVNPNAVGIDIGSRSHWVAVGQNAQDVKEFGVYSDDHQALCEWLKKHEVTTIAMESTGAYWQNLFAALITFGIEVILVNGRQTKNLDSSNKYLSQQLF